MKSSKETHKLRQALLAWYDKEKRTLPWRIRPEDRTAGAVADPYKIWLSEIMCQQTTTKAASAYWHKFLKLWPKIDNLASAPRDDILTAWAGLGYYARARNLHKCAQLICSEYNGAFPDTEAELLRLPGVGPYSAAAIAGICYGEATNVVDGNVERVISRMFCVETLLPKAKPKIRVLASSLADASRPGDYAQALMDLGAHICKPKNPKCEICPWSFACEASISGNMENYPRRRPKPARPVRYGAAFFIKNNSCIWLRKRSENGLLGGMVELPGTDWTSNKPSIDVWLSQAPIKSNWHCIDGSVKHVFTHFTLYLTVFTACADEENFEISANLNKINDYALPSLMRKAISLAHP